VFKLNTECLNCVQTVFKREHSACEHAVFTLCSRCDWGLSDGRKDKPKMLKNVGDVPPRSPPGRLQAKTDANIAKISHKYFCDDGCPDPIFQSVHAFEHRVFTLSVWKFTV
jgi:hypothetical protein